MVPAVEERFVEEKEQLDSRTTLESADLVSGKIRPGGTGPVGQAMAGPTL